jgi:hypothetical protein
MKGSGPQVRDITSDKGLHPLDHFARGLIGERQK